MGLIFDLVDSINNKITSSKLKDSLVENLSDYDISPRRVSKMLYELKKNKYIEYREGDSVVFTNKAKIKIIDRLVEGKNSDNKYRLVSFDIPEIFRSNRNNFRRAIKRMGFRQVQKSLWVTDRNVGNLVEIAAIEYNVSRYIAYFVSDKSNIDNHIIKVLNDEQ